MKYIVVMSDTFKDERVEAIIEVHSVFDAIDMVEVEDPENMELIAAYPIG